MCSRAPTRTRIPLTIHVSVRSESRIAPYRYDGQYKLTESYEGNYSVLLGKPLRSQIAFGCRNGDIRSNSGKGLRDRVLTARARATTV